MSATVKGWCPGALRPMMSGDGLLVRLRPRCATLAAATAREIAACAAEYGNGLIELTSRANLQLRGVREDALPALQDRLASLGLLDPDAATEGLRNIIASPLAGPDPCAVLDIRPVVAALESALAGDARLAGLPGKFGFVVGDGGSFDLSGVDADVAFRAVATAQGPQFAVYLAGREDAAGQCRVQELPTVAVAIAAWFLDVRQTLADPPRRMRGLPGSRTFSPPLPLLDASQPGTQERVASPRSGDEILGIHPGFLGIGKPFGRWTAVEWRGLADAVLFHAGPEAEFRLTPWRSIVIPSSSAALAAEIDEIGGILDPADPRLAIVACPGAPACASATTATQADAARWASLARLIQPNGIGLHVSGCGKSCARHEKTRVTLVARAGLYDLMLDGLATNRASVAGLDVAAATAALAALAAGTSPLESVL